MSDSHECALIEKRFKQDLSELLRILNETMTIWSFGEATFRTTVLAKYFTLSLLLEDERERRAAAIKVLLAYTLPLAKEFRSVFVEELLTLGASRVGSSSFSRLPVHWKAIGFVVLLLSPLFVIASAMFLTPTAILVVLMFLCASCVVVYAHRRKVLEVAALLSRPLSSYLHLRYYKNESEFTIIASQVAPHAFKVVSEMARMIPGVLTSLGRGHAESELLRAALKTKSVSRSVYGSVLDSMQDEDIPVSVRVRFLRWLADVKIIADSDCSLPKLPNEDIYMFVKRIYNPTFEG
jgi:hypothetical protein